MNISQFLNANASNAHSRLYAQFVSNAAAAQSAPRQNSQPVVENKEKAPSPAYVISLSTQSLSINISGTAARPEVNSPKGFVKTDYQKQFDSDQDGFVGHSEMQAFRRATNPNYVAKQPETMKQQDIPKTFQASIQIQSYQLSIRSASDPGGLLNQVS